MFVIAAAEVLAVAEGNFKYQHVRVPSMMALTLVAKVPRAVLTEARVGVVAMVAATAWAAASKGVGMAASANTAAN